MPATNSTAPVPAATEAAAQAFVDASKARPRHAADATEAANNAYAASLSAVAAANDARPKDAGRHAAHAIAWAKAAFFIAFERPDAWLD